MSPGIESVIVLMLENRSFDHMLGFLDHPSPAFDGLTGEESNPGCGPEDPPVRVTATARTTLTMDPGHEHAQVLFQLTGERECAPPYSLTNSGFVACYEELGRSRRLRRGLGPLIMECQPPGNVPVLAELARGFAVCTRWFSSVPGETGPNRNFAHAATSDGEVDNALRLYSNPTIYEHLGAAGRRWGIYHHGGAQAWFFRQLWCGVAGGGFGSHANLLQAIAEDRLPHYAFVEPDHFWPSSSSQHPWNNRWYDDDFARGEELVRQVYEALLDRPDVFAKTLLAVVYDEHGGFYDHVAPPYDPRFNDPRAAPGGFAFDLLGLRVPAVLVSPLIPPATVDAETYDHTSIAASLRALFMPGSQPLTDREAQAASFLHNLSLASPRAADLPRLPPPPAAKIAVDARRLAAVPDETDLDDFQRSLVWLTEAVAGEMEPAGRRAARSMEVMAAEAAAHGQGPTSAAALRLRQEQVSQMVWQEQPADSR